MSLIEWAPRPAPTCNTCGDTDVVPGGCYCGESYCEAHHDERTCCGPHHDRYRAVIDAIDAAAKAGAASSTWHESRPVCESVHDELDRAVCDGVRVTYEHLDHDALMWDGYWGDRHHVTLTTLVPKVQP